MLKPVSTTVLCAECGRKYRLASSSASGAFTCKGCGSRITVDAGASRTRTPAPKGTGGAAPPEIKLSGYEIRKKLGAGGMGAVYLARQMSVDRDVALKILSGPLAGQAGFAERFLREARAAARLSHPNLIQVFDAGVEGSLHYFSMEFVEGEDLEKRIKRAGPLDPAEAARIIAESADALEAAHAAGVVHRDIKPSNIIVTKQGRVKVADLGLAKEMHEGSNLTVTGQVLGTPDFIAPEQATGESTADPRSDIYSLGCTWFYLLTGRPVFEGKTPFDIIRRHVSEPPVLPASLEKSPTGAVLLRMIAKSQDERYADMREVREEARRLAAGRMPQTTAVPLSATGTAPPAANAGTTDFEPDDEEDEEEDWEEDPWWRRPWAWGVAAALVLLILGIAIGAGLGRDDEEEVGPETAAETGEAEGMSAAGGAGADGGASTGSVEDRAAPEEEGENVSAAPGPSASGEPTEPDRTEGPGPTADSSEARIPDLVHREEPRLPPPAFPDAASVVQRLPEGMHGYVHVVEPWRSLPQEVREKIIQQMVREGGSPAAFLGRGILDGIREVAVGVRLGSSPEEVEFVAWVRGNPETVAAIARHVEVGAGPAGTLPGRVTMQRIPHPELGEIFLAIEVDEIVLGTSAGILEEAVAEVRPVPDWSDDGGRGRGGTLQARLDLVEILEAVRAWEELEPEAEALLDSLALRQVDLRLEVDGGRVVADADLVWDSERSLLRHFTGGDAPSKEWLRMVPQERIEGFVFIDDPGRFLDWAERPGDPAERPVADFVQTMIRPDLLGPVREHLGSGMAICGTRPGNSGGEEGYALIFELARGEGSARKIRAMARRDGWEDPREQDPRREERRESMDGRGGPLRSRDPVSVWRLPDGRYLCVGEVGRTWVGLLTTDDLFARSVFDPQSHRGGPTLDFPMPPNQRRWFNEEVQKVIGVRLPEGGDFLLPIVMREEIRGGEGRIRVFVDFPLERPDFHRRPEDRFPPEEHGFPPDEGEEHPPRSPSGPRRPRR